MAIFSYIICKTKIIAILLLYIDIYQNYREKPHILIVFSTLLNITPLKPYNTFLLNYHYIESYVLFYYSGIDNCCQKKGVDMTASIQIKNNKYYIVLNWTDKNKKRRQKWIKTDLSASGNNKRKAEKLRIEVLTAWQDKDKEENETEMKFSTFIKEWLEITKNSISDNTYFSYRQTIHNSICPYFERIDIKLTDLKPYHIQDFYTYKMTTERVSANTIHHYNANIHKALDFAVKSELIAVNPSDKVDLPKKKKHIAQFYTVDEMQVLLKNAKGSPIETVVLLASWFGLRRGEIIGLKWESIDFANGILSITGTVRDKGKSGSKIKNLRYEPTAKNHSSIRSFPMPKQAIEYLKHLKDIQDKRKQNDGYNHQWDEFVCVRENGDLIPLEYVSRAFPKLCEKSGLKRLKLHELRHTNISLLLKNGASMKELQEWAGHSNYNTTANIYAHIQEESKNRLSKTIEKVLF